MPSDDELRRMADAWNQAAAAVNEVLPPMKQAAMWTRQFHEALVASGFTEDQALRLVGYVLSGTCR